MIGLIILGGKQMKLFADIDKEANKVFDYIKTNIDSVEGLSRKHEYMYGMWLAKIKEGMMKCITNQHEGIMKQIDQKIEELK